jgi:hypothetical protein
MHSRPKKIRLGLSRRPAEHVEALPSNPTLVGSAGRPRLDSTVARRRQLGLAQMCLFVRQLFSRSSISERRKRTGPPFRPQSRKPGRSPRSKRLSTKLFETPSNSATS